MPPEKKRPPSDSSKKQAIIMAVRVKNPFAVAIDLRQMTGEPVSQELMDDQKIWAQGGFPSQY